MQAEGLLKSRVALFDAEKLGFNLVVFVVLRVLDYDKDWHDKFIDKAKAMAEVVEFYRVSGNLDYVAKIIVRDISQYDEIYSELCQGETSRIGSNTYFSTNEVKYTTALPVSESLSSS